MEPYVQRVTTTSTHRQQTLTPDRPRRGLLTAGLLAGVAIVVSHFIASISPLMIAIAAGALFANLGLVRPADRPGLKLASKQFLRVGIFLLGFRLAITDVTDLGGRGMLVVLVTVVVTIVGMMALGHVFGLNRKLAMLLASGYAICGASAIAAMNGVVDADEEDVAMSIVVVTLCGSLAVVAIPAVGHRLGMSHSDLGAWIGASTHDVGQVVAASSAVGADAVDAALVVKLSRVLLLAPLVAGAGLIQRRTSASPSGTRRPPLVPLFVAGFLGAVGIRSTGLLPVAFIDGMRHVEGWTLAIALAALGTGAELASLRRVGAGTVAVGLLGWLLIAAVSALGILALPQ